MFYTIYKITNVINNKIYIGKHQTKNLNDDYMGSGKQLKRAQVKHGIGNFKKEILFQFDNESEMNAKEAELVTEEFCLREDTYNLCPGGKGGWGYINSNPEITTPRNRKNIVLTQTPQARAKTSKNTDYSKIGFSVASKETLTHLALEATRKYKEGRNLDPTKYKTVWITDGSRNKKIRPEEKCPDGWKFGRTI